MEDVLYETRNALSQIFMVPSWWFEGPIFVVNLVIPFITMAVLFYMILSTKIRLFGSDIVKVVLSICMAFFSIPAVVVFNPALVVSLTTFGIVTSLGDRITLMRLVLAVAAGIAAWFAVSYIAGVLSAVV